MKLFKLILTLIIITSLFACDPPVTFNEPQPVDTDNLSKFPKRIHGKYLSLSDSSFLVVNEKLIQRIYDFDQMMHTNQLDSNSQLSGDTIINLVNNSRELIQRLGDTMITHVHYIDTLFKMDDDNVVRKFKGYYFLNKRYDKESWEVSKIEFLKGKLIVSGISNKEDIENLKTITASTQDTVAPHKFAATKKQFKQFVRNSGFSDSETFIRLK
jgi:hypothetical protein